MAIGYANKHELAQHLGHDIEVAVYGDGELGIERLASVTIECNDCGEVLIDTTED